MTTISTSRALFYCLFLTCLFFSHLTNASTISDSSLNSTSRIIVKFRTADASANIQQQLFGQMRQLLGAQVEIIRQTSTGAFVIELPEISQQMMNQAVSALNYHGDISYAEPDLLLQIMATPNDPRFSDQWHYYEEAGGLNLVSAWDITTGSEGLVVAVIDTGIIDHEDLAGQYLPGYDFIHDIDVSNDGDGRDADASDPGDWIDANECGNNPERDSSWHGTHVAGTIAAKTNNNIGVAGVAWNARILPVRVLGKCGGYTSDIIDAVRWSAGLAVDGVPTNTTPARVINMSLGGFGGCGRAFQEAVDEVNAAGSIVVVAAGNSNADASNFTPASCDGVVTVAATNREAGRAFYSNFGNTVEIAAPGGETSTGNRENGVLSTLNTGTQAPEADGYAFYQGTSMATPHVAGVAALMLSVRPALTPEQVSRLMQTTAKDFPTTVNNQCIVGQCGAGLLDANAAVIAARDFNGEDPVPSDDQLENGVSRNNLSTQQGESLHFVITVPEPAELLEITLSGGRGDADLFVRAGEKATRNRYDAKSENFGNDDSVRLTSVAPGDYHIAVYGYQDFSGASLVAEYSGQGELPGSDLVKGIPLTDLSAQTGEGLTYKIEVPEGVSNLTFTTQDGTGDADLYVKFGEPATTDIFDFRSQRFGNSDSITVSEPQLGAYFVFVYAYEAFEGLQLVANYSQDNHQSDPFSGENDTNFDIPDLGFIESPIDVTFDGDAGKVGIDVSIVHTYIGDIRIELVAPSGISYLVREQMGGNQADLNTSFVVDATGESALGVWRLRVSDGAVLDTGTLLNWKITLPLSDS